MPVNKALHSLSHAGQRTAYVRFNSRGISGTITFTEASASSVRIVASLQGLRGIILCQGTRESVIVSYVLVT